MRLKGLIFILLAAMLVVPVAGQKSLDYILCEKSYETGLDLYNKEKYAAAQYHFQKYLNEKHDDKEKNVKAEYYISACAIELFNEDAEYLITSFINDNQGNNKVSDANLKMALFKFREGSRNAYEEALKWFDKVNTDDLDEEQLAEYYFKSGYSNFVLENFDKAEKSFFEIKNTKNKYNAPATYFYSHIMYLKKNYQTALDGFTKLSTDEMFAPIVPYYISQIYYLKKDYAKVIEYVPSLLDTAKTKRQDEIARIIGEAYYQTLKYKESIPYLQMYREKSSNYTREDVYQLGYANYRSGNYQEAATHFEGAVNLSDKLSQNAYYHIGDCYLRLGNKHKARMAFSSASKSDENPAIREDAMYNYAKLTYELSYSPFNESIRSFTEYINTYPESKHLDEFYSYLGNVYMTTKNYKEALVALESIRKVNAFIEETYQKVAFFMAVELFKNKEYEEAIIHFDKSLNNAKYNDVFKAQSYFWKAESYYKLERFKEAQDYYKKFSQTNGVIGTPEYDMVDYNVGYTFFKTKEYSQALTSFRKYLKTNESKKNGFVCDALLRTGDCYYIDKKFDLAVESYGKAVDMGMASKDYALYQKGISHGLDKDGYNSINMKIITLADLINSYPESPYIDDALFEQGRAYIETESGDMAIGNFQQILDNHPGSPYYKKSLLHIASVYQYRGEFDQAKKLYEQVARDFKGQSEAADALAQLETIYAKEGNMKPLEDLYQESGTTYDKLSADSVVFVFIEKEFREGKNYPESKKKLINYIANNPSGRYLIKAHYYKALINMMDKENEAALESYNYILTKGKSEYSEEAALQTAKIYFGEKNYEKALGAYTALESYANSNENKAIALLGKMRCQHKLGKHYEAIITAEKCLNIEKLEDNQVREIHYIKGLGYYTNNELDPALEEFMFISGATQTQMGAEAKYMVAKIFYDKQMYDVAEKEIFDFAKKGTNHQYWLGMSFLLGSDVFLAKNDIYQAKSTLQSIIDNYSIKTDGILENATKKLQKIIEDENKKAEEAEGGNLEINLENNSLENSLMPE